MTRRVATSHHGVRRRFRLTCVRVGVVATIRRRAVAFVPVLGATCEADQHEAEQPNPPSMSHTSPPAMNHPTADGCSARLLSTLHRYDHRHEGVLPDAF